MTTIDSKTIASLDPTDFVSGTTENKDNAQVEALQVTSEELKSLQDESDFDSLTYIPKGHGSLPMTVARTKPSAPKNDSSSKGTSGRGSSTRGTSGNDSSIRGSSRKDSSTRGTSSGNRDGTRSRN